ncbi:MAG: hypothetical protein PHT59_07470 [Candidatus Omnitrophica bacterium]|nr:hypothetical protein [Candidatus Omnitrophota bacterium]
MKLSRFLSIILPLTVLSVVYVWQQTEVVSLAYEGQRKLAQFQELLDENSNLRYNLKRNTSLVYLGSKVSGGKEFSMPGSYCLVKVDRPSERSLLLGKRAAPRKTLAARLLEFGREAQAKTIHSSLTFKTE